jgi:hypothetical protein
VARGGWGAGKLLAAAVVVHVALHLAVSLAQQGIEHDDSISYLAASGHQGLYSRIIESGSAPYDTWGPAGAWRRMLSPEEPFVFGRIARDLGQYDIHPPLYFWLLHLGMLAFGMHPWVGPILNLGLDLLAIPALFLLARRVLGDERRAGLSTLLWAASPGPLAAALEARQYSLFGLIAILFFLQVLRAADEAAPFGPGRAALLFATTGLGLFSHYQFALVAAGGGALLALRLFRRSPRRLGLALLAIAAGFALLLPGADLVRMSFARQKSQLAPFDPAMLLVRFTSVLAAPSTLFVVGRAQQVAWVTAALGAILWLFVSLRRRGSRLRDALAGLEQPSRDVLLLYGAYMVAVSALYLAFRTPDGALRHKYLCWAHPLAAILLVRGLAALPERARWRALLPVGLLLLGNAMWISGAGIHRSMEMRAARASLAEVDRLVLDTTSRGVVLPIVWQLPEDLQVFISPRKKLREEPARWLPVLTRRSLWIHDPTQGSSVEGDARLDAAVRTRFTLAPTRSPLWPTQVIYRLDEPPG